MSNQGAFQAAPTTGMDNTKLGLSTAAPSGNGQRSSLRWKFQGNNPRIVVWTGNPEEKQDQRRGYGKIIAKLDPRIFSGLIQMLRAAATTEGEFNQHLKCKDFTFFGGKRSQAPEVTALIVVKKNAEGVIGISVVDAINKQRDKIMFPIMAPDFAEIVDGSSGERITKAEESKLFTLGYANIMEGLVTTLLATNWVEPPKRDNNGGGNRNGGGGYNNNRGGNGGGGYDNGGNGGGNGGGGGGGDYDAEIPF